MSERWWWKGWRNCSLQVSRPGLGKKMIDSDRLTDANAFRRRRRLLIRIPWVAWCVVELVLHPKKSLKFPMQEHNENYSAFPGIWMLPIDRWLLLTFEPNLSSMLMSTTTVSWWSFGAVPESASLIQVTDLEYSVSRLISLLCLSNWRFWWESSCWSRSDVRIWLSRLRYIYRPIEQLHSFDKTWQAPYDCRSHWCSYFHPGN